MKRGEKLSDKNGKPQSAINPRLCTGCAQMFWFAGNPNRFLVGGIYSDGFFSRQLADEKILQG